jgi:hypothetical protein
MVTRKNSTLEKVLKPRRSANHSVNLPRVVLHVCAWLSCLCVV